MFRLSITPLVVIFALLGIKFSFKKTNEICFFKSFN